MHEVRCFQAAKEPHRVLVSMVDGDCSTRSLNYSRHHRLEHDSPALSQ